MKSSQELREEIAEMRERHDKERAKTKAKFEFEAHRKSSDNFALMAVLSMGTALLFPFIALVIHEIVERVSR